MAIVFPASPSVNDTFTAGSITYKWDGDKWIGLGVTGADIIRYPALTSPLPPALGCPQVSAFPAILIGKPPAITDPASPPAVTGPQCIPQPGCPQQGCADTGEPLTDTS